MVERMTRKKPSVIGEQNYKTNVVFYWRCWCWDDLCIMSHDSYFWSYLIVKILKKKRVSIPESSHWNTWTRTFLFTLQPVCSDGRCIYFKRDCHCTDHLTPLISGILICVWQTVQLNNLSHGTSRENRSLLIVDYILLFCWHPLTEIREWTHWTQWAS